jgi:hypothetical protein
LILFSQIAYWWIIVFGFLPLQALLLLYFVLSGIRNPHFLNIDEFVHKNKRWKIQWFINKLFAKTRSNITFVNQIIESDRCEAHHYNLLRTALIVIAVGFPGLFLEPMPSLYFCVIRYWWIIVFSIFCFCGQTHLYLENGDFWFQKARNKAVAKPAKVRNHSLYM